MKLNVRAMALALGATTALFFVLCSLLYMIAPGMATWTGRLFHIDVSSIFRPVAFGDLILGTISWWVLMAAIAGSAAWLYNRAVRP
jgi:hypothetical protein